MQDASEPYDNASVGNDEINARAEALFNVAETLDGETSSQLLDLAVPSYNIEAQDWFAAPLAENASVWTDPYFDAGGGEVWRITCSVPVRDAEGIFAIITTDLTVDVPTR